MRARRALATLYLLAGICASLLCGGAVPPLLGETPSNVVIITSISSASTNGDYITVQGTGFQNPWMSVLSHTAGAADTALGVQSGATAGMFAALVPPMGLGTYDVQIGNQGSRGIVVAGGLSVINVPTMLSIYPSPTLLVDYPAVLAICSGGCVEGSTVTGLTDISGNGLNATCTGTVTYHASYSGWLMPSQPAVEIGGAGAYCTVSSLSLGGSAALYGVGAFNVAADSSGDVYLAYYGSNLLALRAPSPGYFATYAGGSDYAANTRPLALNTSFIGIGGASYAASTLTLTNSVNNAAAVSSGFALSALASPEALYIGHPTSSATFYFPRIAFVNVVPTATQTLQTAELLNLTYGITQPPGFVYGTPMLAACTSSVNCYGRFQITNAEPSMTATLSGGIGALTMGTIAASGLYADVQEPTSTSAGTYSLTLTNPDGRANTFPNAISINTQVNPENYTGPYLVGWWQNSWSCTGGCAAGNNVTSNIDLGGLGNNLSQGTMADQPTVSSLADPLFNHAPTLVANGSSDYLIANLISDAVGTGIYEFSTWKNATTPSGSAYVLSSTSGTQLQLEGAASTATKPRTLYSANPITWGTAIGTTVPAYIVSRGTGTGTYTYGIDVNDDGSLEVTTTGSGTTSFVLNDFAQFGSYSGSAFSAGTTGGAALVLEDLSSNAAALKALCEWGQTQVASAVCP